MTFNFESLLLVNRMEHENVSVKETRSRERVTQVKKKESDRQKRRRTGKQTDTFKHTSHNGRIVID